MPSPFPGMDPYLENPALWPDFHAGMIVAMRAELNRKLPPGYAARIDRHVWIHEPDANERRLLGKPDVYIAQPSREQKEFSATAIKTAPQTITLPFVRRLGNRYLEILDLQRHRVLTVIELLSPSNKEKGEDRNDYLSKRNEYLATGTNLVEMDFLRAGTRMPMGEPQLASSHYLILVCEAVGFPESGAWPFSIREPFPEIPVPLGPGEPAVLFAVKSCFDRAYEEARYSLEIDYQAPPYYPLTEADLGWVRELLSRKGPGTP